MSRDAEIAIDAIVEAYGHETAHLDNSDRLMVSARVIRNILETIEDISMGFELKPSGKQE